MGFIGGDLQERFVERIRGVDPARLLAVPIDVGRRAPRRRCAISGARW